MSAIVGLALARTGYLGPPVLLLVPAEDGSHYATECHRAALRQGRTFQVLCRRHGLRTHAEHADVCDAPALSTPDDARALASTVRGQIGFFSSPLYVESWLWRAEEHALSLSRRVQVIRAPMADMHVLERLGWLAADEGMRD
ncbi:hypothetical protein QDA04_gp06 [Microbacterium phage Megan]|uniref:Uncharacterized protein n=1 Tax=Microbacterium phage Megan TaxID=2656551 RepID=A0A649VJZ3_9CAUD|nr:hypothetical protein QDA04_gp06 [Microbacterium phage Megan]QGJ92677.1 hypothetical protein PBI_MEGAN_6 [Microbacterium phage Megan]